MAVYLTFDEMREALGITEGELKKLVSEGEVRAFRRGSRMVFRASDLDDLRHRLRHDLNPPLRRRAEDDDEHKEPLTDRAAEAEAPSSPHEADAEAPAPPADDIPVARLAESDDSRDLTGSELVVPSGVGPPTEVREAAPPGAGFSPAIPISVRDVAYVLLVASLVAALLALFA